LFAGLRVPLRARLRACLWLRGSAEGEKHHSKKCISDAIHVYKSS
jgi:hypothetical protein